KRRGLNNRAISSTSRLSRSAKSRTRCRTSTGAPSMRRSGAYPARTVVDREPPRPRALVSADVGRGDDQVVDAVRDALRVERLPREREQVATGLRPGEVRPEHAEVLVRAAAVVAPELGVVGDRRPEVGCDR